MKKMYMTVLDREKLGKDYYRHYGSDAQITRLGRINLIHLDNPSAEEVKRRIEDAKREPACNCAICKDYARHPLDIIYTNIEIPGLAMFN